MRIFVTGANGFIGQATVRDLLTNGHQVLALARSEASAQAVTELGAEVHRGDLEDPPSLASGASQADGVIHLAFIHDFANFARALAADRAAIEAMGDALAGTGKPLVIASGTLAVLDHGERKGMAATEETEPNRNTPPFSERVKSEDLVRELGREKAFRGMVMRLTPTVHGRGGKGFIQILADTARKNGQAFYVGDGKNRWPAVHRVDAASCLRLAVERGREGAIYHAVAEEGVEMRDIMELIGKKLGLPVKGIGMKEASEAIGFFTRVVAADDPTSSDKTRKELGWAPGQIGLLEDIEANYFS